MARPPKYKDEYVEQAYKVCSQFGAIDEKLSEYFEVAISTISKWKLDNPEFSEALKKGKDEFDTRKVEVSLRERACGYSHPDVHISNYQGEITITEITKHYPPDTTACIFWLCNRNRERWHSVNKTEIEVSENLKDQLIAYADALSKSDTDSD